MIILLQKKGEVDVTIPKYYRKLIDAAEKKGRDEWEIYRSVSRTIEDILQEHFEQDKTLVIKSLIAYIEGKNVTSWYVAMISLAYTVILTIINLLSSYEIEISVLTIFIVLLMMCAVVFVLVACYNPEFEKKVVLCVLNDKLEEYIAKEKNDESQMLEKYIEVIVLDNKKNKNKKKTKGKK